MRVLLALALCALSAALSATIATRPPWLGLSFLRGADGVQPVLAALPADGPAARAGVRAGDTVVAVGRTPVGARDLLEEPDVLDTWVAVDGFFARQTRLRVALDAPAVPLALRDARGTTRIVAIVPRPTRPLDTLPLAFWLQLTFGAVGAVVGTWLWALRPRDAGARAYAATGVCFLVFAHAAAIYSARELALPGALFRTLGGVNHLGATMFGAALCALFLTYPRRLASARTIGALAVVGLAWWAANVTRLAPDQNWASRFPVLLAMLGAVGIAGVQWRRTRRDPAARAVLRWFGASVLLGCGLFVGTTAAVSAWGGTPAIPQGYAFGFFCLMYVGLAAGLRRYRLFDLDEWALRILFGSLAVAVVVALDVVLLGVAGTATARTGTVVVLLALATFPVRRWIWARVLRRAAPSADLLVARGLGVAYAPSDDERALRWRALLTELFDPLVLASLDATADATADAVLRDEGLALAVPALAFAPALRLSHAAAGRRLFGVADVALADTLVRLMRAADESRQAFEAGVRGERTRIARDLHDTVSSPLLAGLARASDDTVRRDIRRAVDEMRSVVAGVASGPAPLADDVADARYAAVERLTARGIAVDWPLVELGPHRLGPTERAAFAAFVQEAVTNVMRHAEATRVSVRVAFADGVLTCGLVDDGRGLSASVAAPDGGQGIPNLHARAAALGGYATVRPRTDGPGTEVRLVARLAASSTSAA